jgi:hypothetical protein
MSIIEIYYQAKCKHCLHRIEKKNKRNKYQSFCKIKEEFITLRDKICNNFKL